MVVVVVVVVRGEDANVRLEFGEENWAWLWSLGRDCMATLSK